MALTVSIVEKFVVGSRLGVVADITFDSSYTTGGEDLTPQNLGFRNSLSFFSGGVARNATTGAVEVRHNRTANKIQAFWGDNANAAAAALIEVASTTDLSAYVVRVFAIGK